jgi:hypothetical protein
MPNQKIIGGFEVVSFPELNVKDTIAKVDTGAYSGALHATNVHESVGEDGKKILIFYPLGQKRLQTSTTGYKRKSIKSSNGQLETRYIIKTQIELNGKTYPITISLSDRTAMMKHVLIGRQFLRRHRFIVDVRKGVEHRYVVKDRKKQL